VILVSGFLMAGACAPAWSAAGDRTEIGGLTFIPLTPEAATKLPPWVNPADVVGMSEQMAATHENAGHGTTLAAMDTREQAQALLDEVSRHIRHAQRGSFNSPQGTVEYRAGVRAFGEGKYAEAIEHLRAADRYVAGIPNERVEVG
jgi:hypothetical protein